MNKQLEFRIFGAFAPKAFGVIAIGLTTACFGLLPSPIAFGTDTDGVLPGGNNAAGTGVLTNRTTGIWNSGFGVRALQFLRTGSANAAVGFRALELNDDGSSNTAMGALSLGSNVSGKHNTAAGYGALFFNVGDPFPDEGWFNSAFGSYALLSNTTGFRNTAVGAQALLSNSTGIHNTGIGFSALTSNTDGTSNTATGSHALESNTGGSANTAYGAQALDSNTTGSQNVAVGTSALLSNTSGSRNIAIGVGAGELLTTGDDNINIGNRDSAVAGESGTIRIGTQGTQIATFVAGISGATASGGVAVYVNSDGKLGTLTSSSRFKTEIRPMDKSSEVILALRPVTFHYKKDIDPDSIPQFGLVAEEVDKMNPNLVTRDAEGRVYAVRYEAVNAMLLNEFLKAHRKIEEQEDAIAQLKSGMETLIATVKEQASQMQKVSAQLEMSNPGP